MHSAVGDIKEGTVVRVYPRYAILLFDDGETGLLHISELSTSFVRNFTSLVGVGNIYKVKVIAIDPDGSMRVSAKRLNSSERHRNFKKKHISDKDTSFDALEKALPAWIEEENKEGN